MFKEDRSGYICLENVTLFNLFRIVAWKFHKGNIQFRKEISFISSAFR